ncbi:MAG: TRASH domain-containing protein [Thermoplasmataceae archaeon]|jgi:DNA-binding Lrp family transcriptional regulator
MNTNQAETEQRMLTILKNDSRKSIIDLAHELKISRITARKVLDSLIQSGKIRKFTISIDEDERDLVMIHTSNMEKIPKSLVVESFDLVDNTFIVVMYYENLLKVKDIDILDLKVALNRTVNTAARRISHIHCDYCNDVIQGAPLTISSKGRIYYACCQNCRKDLERRLETEQIEA